MSYEAVIFDNDGVLVKVPSRESVMRAAERTFRSFDLRRPTREDMHDLVAGNVKNIRQLSQRHDIDAREFCYTAATYAVREQKREFEAGLRSLYDDVRALGSLSHPFGLVSDNQPEILRHILRVFGLEERFDVVYGCPFTPEGFQRRKPNPYYLNAALSDLGTNDAVYVGDSACDVEAAANAGIDSVLLRRDEETSECTATPTYEIDSLRALPALVV